MAVILPESFDLSQLKNDSEKEVVRALRDQLSENWFIIPSLQMTSSKKDYELDVILIHQDYGIMDVEVKGHRVRVEQGVWYSGSQKLDPQPFVQARSNAHALKDRLKAKYPDLFKYLHVHYAVALPNSRVIEGELPPDVGPEQLWLADTLLDVFDTMQEAFFRTSGNIFGRDAVVATIKHLLPDVDFDFDEEAAEKRARARLDEICAAQVRCMESLDNNRRVVVTGKAGTGKTRLASAWVRRALAREERVLFVCFNEPLAEQIGENFPDQDDLIVGPFLQVARTLPGMPFIAEPADADPEALKHFWNVEVIGHLHSHWHKIEAEFDTIVIDEAQDFSPAWIAQLESLLHRDGPRRIMMVADADQDIFNRGFILPNSEDGWVVGELSNNCRNTQQIAKLLRRILNGAAAPERIPDSSGVTFVEVPTSETEVAQAVAQTLGTVGSKDVAIIVQSQRWRDLLRDSLNLGSWETRHERTPCETVRRLKGTEFSSVVIVDPDGTMDQQALYIGVSRAVNQLSVLGPRQLGEYLGLI